MKKLMLTKVNSLNQRTGYRQKKKEVDIWCHIRSQTAKIFNFALPRMTANTRLRSLPF